MENLFNKSLQDLKLEDLRLREQLEGELEGDRKFEEIISDLARELRKIQTADEGIEKARLLASARALFNKLQGTERFKLSEHFLVLSKEKEARELDSARAQKSKLLGFRRKA